MAKNYFSYEWWCSAILMLLISDVRGQSTKAITFNTGTLSTNDEHYAKNKCSDLKEASLEAKKKWDGNFFLPSPRKDIKEVYCYENTFGRMNEKSWSPVEVVYVRCPYREPVGSIEHRCESQYCTDPLTGKKNVNLVTKQLTMNVTVCVRSHSEGSAIPRVESRGIGCTCLFPLIN